MTREFKYINGTLKFIDCEIWTTNIKFQKYLQIKYKREKSLTWKILKRKSASKLKHHSASHFRAKKTHNDFSVITI